jgi:uncharacterized membrane protein
VEGYCGTVLRPMTITDADVVAALIRIAFAT